MIILETIYGPIKIELDFVNTPKTSELFLKHVQSGFYDGTVFHRVIPKFVIQGGMGDASLTPKTAISNVENEADKGSPNERGTIAMARTQDPNSASSQFFINVADNKFLNHREKSVSGWGYCVFGKVIDGMDIVDKIQNVPTGQQNGHSDVPVQPVVIERAYEQTEK